MGMSNIFCRYTTLETIYHLLKIFPQASFPSLTLTYTGTLRAPYFSHHNPPRFTQKSSLVLDLSFTKLRGTYIEVKVIGVPSCVTHLVFGLGFSQATIYVITLMVRKISTFKFKIVLVNYLDA
jgi:hypothetical protein